MKDRRILWHFGSITWYSVVAANIHGHSKFRYRSLTSLMQARANECVPLAKIGYVADDTSSYMASYAGGGSLTFAVADNAVFRLWRSVVRMGYGT